MTPIQTAAHEAQIARHREVIAMLLEQTTGALRWFGVTDEQINKLTAVAAAKELVG